MAEPVRGYSRLQMGLHWAVVVLVAFQFLAHNAIEAGFAAQMRSEPPPSDTTILSSMHMAGGLIIFALALGRIYLRLARGAPDPPADEPRVLKFTSETVHALIYAMLLSLPVTGVFAWFLGIETAATLHEYLQAMLLGLISLHIGGALFQHLVRRSDVMMRMFAAEKH